LEPVIQMDEREYYLTSEGAAKFRAELEELRGPRRAALAKRLRFAIQQGDLTENADYIAAKEEQAFLEGRIKELEIILRDAIIVNADDASDQVVIGSSVLVAEDNREPELFHLVGVKEADTRKRKISYESPIGSALLGKRVGEVAIAETPAGKIKFTILKIS
jgi:transcription elongation factor GreA